MYNLVTTFYYEPDDTEFNSDYTRVTVESDGEVLQEFGDDYHDKGLDKAYGFVLAFYTLFGTDEVRHKEEKRLEEEE